MLNTALLNTMIGQGRITRPAVFLDPALGILNQLPGTWANVPPAGSGLPNLAGHGWNLIGLPFANNSLNFRLLLNQYNETLSFPTVITGVPNRGLQGNLPNIIEGDQHVAALEYNQHVDQLASADATTSGTPVALPVAVVVPATQNSADTPKGPAGIHREPGLFLHMANAADATADIARLGTIPHGDAVLALGHGTRTAGGPNIPTAAANPNMALPLGAPTRTLADPYMLPYLHFHQQKFLGLFDPSQPTDLLIAANNGIGIKSTTTLTFDTGIETGGILNTPFIKAQAVPTSMQVTFWIQELNQLDPHGHPILRMQYLQIVIIEFGTRRDGVQGLIQWPHISINTMVKIA